MQNANAGKGSNQQEPTTIYEDESVLVIDKPIGWLVHDDGKGVFPTVVEWFLRHTPEARGVGEPATSTTGETLDRSGVVHRLDRETSGILVLAKLKRHTNFSSNNLRID